MNKIEKKLYEFFKMYFILVHPCVKIHLGHLLCICLSLSIVAVNLGISGCVWDRALKFFRNLIVQPKGSHPRPRLLKDAASTSSGACPKYKFLSSSPDLLTQNLQGWCPGVHVNRPSR